MARFPGEPDAPADALAEDGPIDAETAEDLGLVTAALDDIDWDDEVRIAIEERVSLSPDALTGMEQNLRFGVLRHVKPRSTVDSRPGKTGFSTTERCG